jgi:hypothetical protein
VRQHAEPEPRLPQRADPHLAGQEAGPSLAAEQREEPLEHGRREDVQTVAVGEHDPADPARVLVEDELAQRAAGVTADQRDGVEVEGVEELDDQPRDAARRQVGVRVHGDGVRTHRPVGRVRADPLLGQTLGDPRPQPAVGEHRMDEDDGRRHGLLRSRDSVVDGSAG